MTARGRIAFNMFIFRALKFIKLKGERHVCHKTLPGLNASISNILTKWSLKIASYRNDTPIDFNASHTGR